VIKNGAFKLFLPVFFTFFLLLGDQTSTRFFALQKELKQQTPEKLKESFLHGRSGSSFPLSVVKVLLSKLQL
jgi:hypothetical protein